MIPESIPLISTIFINLLLLVSSLVDDTKTKIGNVIVSPTQPLALVSITLTFLSPKAPNPNSIVIAFVFAPETILAELLIIQLYVEPVVGTTEYVFC